jgi:predicted nucleic acid-binding protein
MNGDKVFLDTNIFVYYFITGEEAKGSIARRLIEETVTAGTCVASYQVWQEFISVGLRKSNRKPVAFDALVSAFGNLSKEITVVHSSHNLFTRAYSLWTRFQLQWYDSLIVAAALESGCRILYSEDMQDGLDIDGMTIVNPFKTQEAGLH